MISEAQFILKALSFFFRLTGLPRFYSIHCQNPLFMQLR